MLACRQLQGAKAVSSSSFTYLRRQTHHYVSCDKNIISTQATDLSVFGTGTGNKRSRTAYEKKSSLVYSVSWNNYSSGSSCPV
ncbi:unnamed protein product [Allacma fusca]|uniref:Uncharacterized protein n=1 Tax=Allacma fusca TaxID=39272 RepID=A0A8J2LHX6_9HEXA|nr:unnamed protein product [Allacma fusca]